MRRINVVTEGYSELHFVKQSLNQYFGGDPLFDGRCVQTSRDRRSNYEYRGGITSYSKAKGDIVKWLQSDTAAYVSTMFDFFRLPSDFPDYDKATACQDHYKSVSILEEALKKDILSELPQIPDTRFVPYIQLHEFEALLYTDLLVLKNEYFAPDEIESIERLYEETKDIPPEEINHGAETAPSKRLLRAIDYRKGDGSAELLEAITIDKIREKCSHFSQWLTKLHSLQET